jgi:hypothetical protein
VSENLILFRIEISPILKFTKPQLITKPARKEKVKGERGCANDRRELALYFFLTSGKMREAGAVIFRYDESGASRMEITKRREIATGQMGRFYQKQVIKNMGWAGCDKAL